MFVWTKESICWFQDATKMTSYYKDLASWILCQPDYPLNLQTLYDLGSGISPVTPYLTPFVRHVVAVDLSSDALGAIPSYQGINLVRLQKDWTIWRPERPADLVLLSYCNGILQQWNQLRSLSQRYIAIVSPLHEKEDTFGVREWFPHQMAPTPPGNRETAQDVEAFLQKYSISYSTTKISAAFGQPLQDLSAFYRFMAFYFDLSPEDLTQGYQQKYLQKENDYYLLPHQKESQLFFIPLQSACE